jgi:hypothetical protein
MADQNSIFQLTLKVVNIFSICFLFCIRLAKVRSKFQREITAILDIRRHLIPTPGELANILTLLETKIVPLNSLPTVVGWDVGRLGVQTK